MNEFPRKSRPESPNGKTRCFSKGCRRLVAPNRFHCPRCLETSVGRKTEDALLQVFTESQGPQRSTSVHIRQSKSTTGKKKRGERFNGEGYSGWPSCNHCGGELAWFHHPAGWRPKRNQSYYAEAWQRCLECGTVWFHERYKVFLKPESEAARDFRLSRQLEEETDQAALRWGV